MPEEQETCTEEEMYNEMVKLGISPRDARTAIELCKHAREQAMETVQRITNTAPSHLKSLVVGLTIDNLMAALEQPDVKQTHEDLMVMGMVSAALYCKARDAKEGESKPN